MSPSGAAPERSALLSRVSRRPCRFHLWLRLGPCESSSACMSMNRTSVSGHCIQVVSLVRQVAITACSCIPHIRVVPVTVTLRRWPLLSTRPFARRQSAVQQKRWPRHARDAAAGRQVLHVLQQFHSPIQDWDIAVHAGWNHPSCRRTSHDACSTGAKCYGMCGRVRPT